MGAWDDDAAVALPALQRLDLGGNAHLGDPGVQCLVDGLNNLPNKQQKRFRLYELGLDGCNYSARAALLLCDCLRLVPEFSPRLSDLNISTTLSPYRGGLFYV